MKTGNILGRNYNSGDTERGGKDRRGDKDFLERWNEGRVLYGLTECNLSLKLC